MLDWNFCSVWKVEMTICGEMSLLNKAAKNRFISKNVCFVLFTMFSLEIGQDGFFSPQSLQLDKRSWFLKAHSFKLQRTSNRVGGSQLKWRKKHQLQQLSFGGHFMSPTPVCYSRAAPSSSFIFISPSNNVFIFHRSRLLFSNNFFLHG